MNDKWEDFKQEVLSTIDVESFCEEILGPVKGHSGDEISFLCCFHEDTNPSLSINKVTKLFKCHACDKDGSVIDIWMKHKDLGFKEALLDLGQQKGIRAPVSKKPVNPPIDAALVIKWHEQLMSNGCTAKRWLNEKRGLLDETLVRFQIGWDGERNTIPVRDSRGNIANVRRYNAKNKLKMLNYTTGDYKYGSPARLYGSHDLVKRDCEEVFIAEGEWDRIINEQYGFPTVTGTHGCKTFRIEWCRFFKGRKLRIVYDCDKEGREAVEKILPIIIKPENQPAEVKVIWLPLAGTKDDKDLSDYYIKHGHTAEDFRALVDAAEAVQLQQETRRDDTIHQLSSLGEMDKVDYIGKRVEVELTVCGETGETFHAPTLFRVTNCSEQGKCFDCNKDIQLDEDCRTFLGVCMSSDDMVERMLRKICCNKGKRPTIEILESTVVREFFAVPRIERQISESEDVNMFDADAQHEHIEKKIYLKANTDMKLVGQSYKVRGWVRSHPKTQQVVLLADKIELLDESFERFEINDKTIEHLKIFSEYEIGDVLQFLSERITRVYERDDLCMAMLLTLCSVRNFSFQSEIIRGWLTTSIVGDSGTAKSQTIMKLIGWTGCGDVFSGLTGSRTGLAYGLAEHAQKGWQIKIGRYPANTRKLLVVDEAQEIDSDDLQKIGKAMDEGKLVVDRIQSGQYESKTRLICLANPKYGRIIDSISYGCQAIIGIYKTMMIRRFDLCLFASSSDLKDVKSVYSKNIDDLSKTPNMPLTADALRSLIFFAWSRRPEHVHYTPAAQELTMKNSSELGDMFGGCGDVPIVQDSDFRKTLARICVPLAVLDGSFTDDFSGVIVKPDHVEKATKFIKKVYSAQNCQLDKYAAKAKLSTIANEEDIAKYKKSVFETGPNNIRVPFGTTELQTEEIRRIARIKILFLHRMFQDEDVVSSKEVQEVLCVDKIWVHKKLSMLKSNVLITKVKYGYSKTAKFGKYLSNIFADDQYKNVLENVSVEDFQEEDEKDNQQDEKDEEAAENGNKW